MRNVAKDDMEIVSRVRSSLSDKVGKERFDLWFGDHVSFAYSDDTIWVHAPDTFTLDRLRTKLRAEIESAVHESLGQQPNLRFAVQTENEPSMPLFEGVGDDVTKFRGSDGSQSNVSERSPNDPSSSDQAQQGSDEISAAAAPQVLSSADRGRTLADAGTVAVATSRPRTRSVNKRVATPKLRQNTFTFRASDASPRPKRRAATLEEFVVGDSNRVAVAGAQSVLSRLGLVSPLFLYGPPGCGKSHLGEAILTAVRAQGCRRAVGLSSEQFTTYFLEALHDRGLPIFRSKYRDVELLVIDDVQFLAGKKATLVEFQHTLDMLQRRGAQVVLTADRPPADLHGLGQEIVARMSAGLVCGLQTPEYETRIGIVRQFAKQRHMTIPDDVVERIATELLGDARQLSGALHRLQATSDALRIPITAAMAAQSLSDLFRATRRIVRLGDIQRAVCDVFGLDAKTLQTGGKARTVSHPRMLAMWLARKYTRAALAEIGQFFGRRSHTSVLAAQRKVDQLVAKQSTIRLDQHACSVEDALRRIELRLRTG